MDSLPVTNKTAGEPESLKNKTLETGAAAIQVFEPSILSDPRIMLNEGAAICTCGTHMRAPKCISRLC